MKKIPIQLQLKLSEEFITRQQASLLALREDLEEAEYLLEHRQKKAKKTPNPHNRMRALTQMDKIANIKRGIDDTEKALIGRKREVKDLIISIKAKITQQEEAMPEKTQA